MAQPPKKAKKSGVRLEDLAFYFDGVERDRLDATGTSRKTGEVLALRDKLLKLPEEQFDAAIKTVKGLIAESSPKDDATETRAKRRLEASQLYTESTSSSGKSVSKVAAT